MPKYGVAPLNTLIHEDDDLTAVGANLTGSEGEWDLDGLGGSEGDTSIKVLGLMEELKHLQ
jgi:hypothetical protein